jgi:hypothetical protein
MGHTQMPTDILAAMERKTELNRQLKFHTNSGALLLPICICMLVIVMAVELPTFAAAVIATGLN